MKTKKLTVCIIVPVVLVIVLITWFVVTNSKDSSFEPIKIKIGYKTNTGYQNFFVAKAKGYFKKHDIQIEGITFKSTNQMAQALALGQIDATAAGSLEVAARMLEVNPDSVKLYLTLVFYKRNAFFSVLASPKSNINTLADLKGKKVGVMPGTTATSWLKYCVKKFFSPNEMKIQQLEPRIQLQALATGQVDALYTVDPLITIGLQKNIAKVVIKGPENIYMFNPMATGVGMISTKFIKQHKKEAVSFIKAMNDTIDFMRKNPSETRRIIASATGLDKKVANNICLIEYWKADETNYKILAKCINFLKDNGVLKKDINLKLFYTTLK